MSKPPTPSLQEVNSSVPTHQTGGFWKKLMAFVGPAYLVSVGYMDPGNWATDIAGGSRFGYALIWVLLLSNLMALLLQSLSARLGLVAGLDLAQASRAAYPKAVNRALWVLAEVAIAATDLAEVIGMAIGLKLLFGLPLLVGVVITVLDTFLLLILQRFGIRKMEAFIIALIGLIGMSFLAELYFAKPDFGAIASGLVPSLPGDGALYIAIGIIGATVMPHNLYLHSSLVQTRRIERTPQGIRQAIKFNVIDSAVALNLALFVNAAILILAAAAFYSNEMKDITSIEDAHAMLGNVFGTTLAPALFAIALIAAGQSSTLTGTLSGQIVMEGYLNLRLQPWLRRLITRLIAIIPAVITLLIGGESQTENLLVLSQVILSLQLGFAVIPLIHFVSNKKLMGQFVAGPWLIIPAWCCAAIIVGLNGKLVIDTIGEWLGTSEHPVLIACTVVPVALVAAVLLLWVTFRPFIGRQREQRTTLPHLLPESLELTSRHNYTRIAVCVDFSDTDAVALSHALQQGGREATYLLIHITETAGARVMQQETADFETTFDENAMREYEERLVAQGLSIETALGFGNPKERIPEIVNNSGCELLVMGAHGHNWLKDMLFGTTVETVRHRVQVPVLVVKTK
ncbi:MAG: Nramp family divalent metal transporter [Bacteroidia bacterium]|nr:Nramp family divalent metal transporter [Bacteroidia bacterium]